MTFSSDLCNDGGRAINNGDPNWPKTLVGFAARAYEFYQKELQPHGYRLRAEILDFPGGMPGEVGITLGLVAVRGAPRFATHLFNRWPPLRGPSGDVPERRDPCSRGYWPIAPLRGGWRVLG